jgi:uridine kinase
MDDFSEAVAFVLHRYPKMSAHLSELVDRIAPGDLVLVGGLARSGKSTAAAVVAAGLRAAGIDNRLITLDRWIRPVAERRAGVHGRFDLDTALRAMQGWLGGAGGKIALGGYNRFTRTNEPGESLEVGPDTVLVLEGVPALDLFPDTERAVHRILVECDEADRRDRVVADLIARGSDPAEAEAIYQSRQGDEAPFVHAGGRTADHRLRLDAAFQSPEVASDH